MTRTNNHSICNCTAAWHVSLIAENDTNELTLNGNGNTFAQALEDLYFNANGDTYGINRDFPEVVLSGYYELPNECKDFEFPVDCDSLATYAHYCFCKGRVSVEDIMATSCQDGKFTDIPLSAFTAGSEYLNYITAVA